MNRIIQNSTKKAIDLLLAGEVVALPTETVYGLGASIFKPKAIDYIFELKQRPRTNPLIVHVANLQQINTLCEQFPKSLQLLADQFWPGPLTLVLPKSANVPDQITAGKDTVGIRIPNHPLFLEVLEKTGPIAAPSANPFERISPTTAEHVEGYFPKGLKMILDGGACSKGIESTIVGYENDNIIIYRLGSISIEAIEKVVGETQLFDAQKSQVTTPGMSKRHYSPKTKTILSENLTNFVKSNSKARIGSVRFNAASRIVGIELEIILSNSSNLEEAAQSIYKVLHQLDQLNLDFIVIEPLPDYEVGRSINDRLKRASE